MSTTHHVSAEPRRGRSAVVAVVIAIVALAACDSRAQPPPPTGLELPEGAPRAAIEQAAASLIGVLAADHPAATPEVDVRAAGDGLYVVRAVVAGSYPGTGVASVVVDGEGATYGMHGERDLAELVRERGWLAAPPAAPDLLLRLLDAAYFEGMGSTSPAEPGVVAEAGGLTLHFEQFTPPGPPYPWRAVFPAEGPTQLFTVDNTAGTGGGMRQVR